MGPGGPHPNNPMSGGLPPGAVMPPMGSPGMQSGMYNNGGPGGPHMGPGGPHMGSGGPGGPVDPNMAMRMKAQGRYRMGNPSGNGMRPQMPPGAIRPGQQQMGMGPGGMNQHMMPNQGMRQVIS